MPQKYSKPPITEAVIELRYQERISESELNKVHKKLRTQYENSIEHNNIDLELNIESNQSKVMDEIKGYRLSSDNETDILITTQTNFIISRLPLYLGWDNLEERVRRDWVEAKKLLGTTKLNRIGVRFINRIDIPGNTDLKFQLKDYLLVGPDVPDVLPSLADYALQVRFPSDDNKYKVMVNSVRVKSPLVRHSSFILDVDVVKETDLPLKDDDLWDLLAQMRGYKNYVFESCITDKARELFV